MYLSRTLDSKQLILLKQGKGFFHIGASGHEAAELAAATALNPLQKCDVFPDFIVAIDSNEITTQFMNIEKDLKNTWLIYDPVIPPIIPTLFKGKRFIYDSSIS